MIRPTAAAVKDVFSVQYVSDGSMVRLVLA